MKNGTLVERPFFYSPFSFLRGSHFIGEEWLDDIKNSVNAGVAECFEDESGVSIFFRKLPWDTEFFGVPFFRVDFSDFPQNTDFGMLRRVFDNFRKKIALRHPEFYIFSEVPCEDIGVIAGMTGAGWRLIETRVTYYRDDLQKFSYPRRSTIRSAELSDIHVLRETAVEAVNNFDRFHADDFFCKEESSNFLAKFIENSVKGFADDVIVPKEGLPNAFLTGNYIESPLSLAEKKMGKMVLSAVANERRGWYTKLISELSFRFKEKGLDTAFMTTQATNRAVLKVWEHHGYRFGRCSHVFSTYSRNK